MKGSWIVVPLLTGLLAMACSSTDPLGGKGQETVATTTPQAAVPDGISLATSTPSRVTGSFVSGQTTIQFDLAKVGDDIYADITGNGGRPILHLTTTGDDYDFSYMGGALTLHTTKTFITQQRAQGQADPASVSTSSFAFQGDMHVLDQMLALPEAALFPTLSRALGARGITGSDFPASLLLHKVGRQAADALGIRPPSLQPQGNTGYCDAYPNASDSCYGMCGPGCDCWSWVCGDCCYHYGCAVHDSWCREGEWYFCYDITAVIALFGC